MNPVLQVEKLRHFPWSRRDEGFLGRFLADCFETFQMSHVHIEAAGSGLMKLGSDICEGYMYTYMYTYIYSCLVVQSFR